MMLQRSLMLIERVGLAYAKWRSKREYEGQTFTRLNERPIELAFLFEKVAALQPRTVLDVGTGTTALPHLLRTCGCVVTAIDNIRDYWPAGMVNRHWHVLDDDITHPHTKGSFDLVTCVSVLEHIADHQTAVHNMLALLRPGGHLIITCPFNARRYSPNVYEEPGSEMRGKTVGFVTQAYSRVELEGWLASGATLVDSQYWQLFEGEYWTVGPMLPVPRRSSVNESHQIACLLLRR
jgi:SAM-dependent methyltransferase